MEVLANPEELIICPYNKAHHIRRNKMGFHIVRCKKNYPEARIVTCDFNVTHQVPEPEIQYHYQNCPNRKNVEIAVYQEHGQEIDKFPVHNIPAEENDSWDNCSITSYNPNDYCEKTEVLRKIDVESAAKRKNFHVMERNRLRGFSGNKSIVDKSIEEIQPQQPVKFRKPNFLPVTPSQNFTSTENTPDAIAKIVERIKLGANKPYNTKN